MTDKPDASCRSCRLFESLPDSETSAGVCHFPSYLNPANTRVRIDPFFASIGCLDHMPTTEPAAKRQAWDIFKFFAAKPPGDPE